MSDVPIKVGDLISVKPGNGTPLHWWYNNIPLDAVGLVISTSYGNNPPFATIIISGKETQVNPILLVVVDKPT